MGHFLRARRPSIALDSNGLPIDQLSAMPSIHVGWAVLVGYYVWRVSPSWWRIIGPLHAVITCVVVVATGNHWWLDGIVAVAILVGSAWLVIGARRTVASVRAYLDARSVPEDALDHLCPARVSP